MDSADECGDENLEFDEEAELDAAFRNGSKESLDYIDGSFVV